MRLITFDRLDRYALRLFAGPLVMSLVTLLLAQLLERLLRLFDLAASAGAGISSVLWMAADLVPHYLGLALPMAFTAAIFMATARMGDDNELDVMLSAGRSITRIAAPYFATAVVLSMFSLYLYGQLQPLTRYAYHVAMDQVLQTGWAAKIAENRFLDTGQGFTFRADRIDADGRGLRGVFVMRRNGDTEEVTTATRGELVPTADGDGLQLQLEAGLILRDGPGTELATIRFEHGLVIDLLPAQPPPRARGESLREQTLPELWDTIESKKDRKARAEFHGRLARALSLPLLPLMALPLGMASKRGRRTPGVVFATLALLALNHALQFGESLAESGRLHAIPAVWTPYLVFAVLSIWIFRSSLAWPGDNPVSRVVATIERLLERATPAKRKKAKAAA